MKINYDCIRDLLHVLEDNLQYDDKLTYPRCRLNQIRENDLLKQYFLKDIVYSTQMLDEADYISCSIIDSDSNIHDVIYYSITFEGHQYLDSIKDDTVWYRVKEKAPSLTLDIIKSVASSIIVKMLTNQ